MPTVEVVLRGMSLTSNEGNFAPCAVYLVRSGDRLVVYDTGHAGRRMKLGAALARRGVRPEDVDTVVVSHLHWDHAQNTDMFTHARLLVHADELAYAAHPDPGDHATPSWSTALLDPARTDRVGDGDEIAPGVRVLHLPGHTPGSIGLAVDTGDGVAVLSGDAVASAPDALARVCPNVFWDAEQADAANHRVVDLADVIYPGHDRPFRVTAADRVEYLTDIRPVTVTVAGVPASGITVVDRPTTRQRTLLGHARKDGHAHL
ncbi:MAG TPA: N-acyl homoserine lactonase family protein [Pseudonocardiaceae bacterium]|nr:N-acyl homoserine lactonase family protein [Pseudonocardiaceae bacterium]